MLRFILGFTLWAIVLFGKSFSQTTIYSQQSGSWSAQGIWNTASDGSGSDVNDPNSSSYNIVVQGGHAIILSGTRAVGNVTIESGGAISAGGGTLEYLEVYGASIQIDGSAGGGGDGLSFDVNGGACTLSGSGSIQIARLRKDNDPNAASTTNLTIATDITLHYNNGSRTALCNSAIGKSLNLTIQSGRTVTIPFGNVSIDGNDGSNSVNHGGTFTINGTLDLQASNGHLYILSDNSSAFPIQYTIGSGGQVIVGGTLYGNNSGVANAGLTVQSGGVLTLKNNISGWSPSKNTISLPLGSLVEYTGYGSQDIEHQWPYANLTVANSEKYLDGDTEVFGTLTLSGASITLNWHDLRMQTGSSIQGANAGAYIRTNEYGMLIRQVANATVQFPTGNSSYNPITLNNSGAADMIGVRVEDAVYDEGYSGSPLSTDAVDKSWFLEEDFPGGSQIEATAQWQSFSELPGFARSSCNLSYFRINQWNNGNAGPAQGGNPYTRSRNNMSEPEIIAVVSGQALPAELVAFEADLSEEFVTLRWQTASEQNLQGFEVQRSADGAAFTPIGFVEAQGQGADYHYRDESTQTGNIYYRLKMQDLDGASQFSPVRSVYLTGASIEIYPNPVVEYVQFSFPEHVEADFSWSICDLNGQVVATGKGELASKQFRIDATLLRPGFYQLRLQIGQELFAIPFMKSAA